MRTSPSRSSACPPSCAVHSPRPRPRTPRSAWGRTRFVSGRRATVSAIRRVFRSAPAVGALMDDTARPSRRSSRATAAVPCCVIAAFGRARASRMRTASALWALARVGDGYSPATTSTTSRQRWGVGSARVTHGARSDRGGKPPPARTLASAAGDQIKRERSEQPKTPVCSKHRSARATRNARRKRSSRRGTRAACAGVDKSWTLL